MYNAMTTYLYFDNYKFDICDAMVFYDFLSSTHKYALEDFHVSADTSMQNWFRVFSFLLTCSLPCSKLILAILFFL